MAKTEPDFTIKPGCTVWLHNRAWKKGNEAELQKKGFTDKAKREQAKRGMIHYAPKPAPAKQSTTKNNGDAKGEAKKGAG